MTARPAAPGQQGRGALDQESGRDTMDLRARLRRRGALVAGLLMGMSTGLPLATMAQDADPLTSRQLKCNPAADLRCWYLVGGMGEAPQRVAFVARNVDALSAGMRRIEYIQVVEQASHPHRFYMWDLEVDCNAGRFRVLRDQVGNANGTVTDDPVESDQWQAFGEGRFGEVNARPLACAGGEPPADAMFVGNAYRAPDMMHHFRSVFWVSAGR
ncbi:hypothetical protein ACW5EG_08765 [Luteimonas sp. A611]